MDSTINVLPEYKSFSPVEVEEPAREAMEREDEYQLIAQAQRGNKEAFGRLVEEYNKRVYRIAFSILRDSVEAYDVAQEAFIRVYQVLAEYDGRASFCTWVCRVAINRCLNRLRKRRLKKITLYKVEKDNQEQTKFKAELSNPRETLGNKEIGRLTQEAIDQLPMKSKLAVNLVLVEGLSYHEAAEIMGCGEKTVSSRLIAARKKLRKILSPYLR